jgi:hypothetical protein
MAPQPRIPTTVEMTGVIQVELEFGTVKFFDTRDNKRFGFVYVLDEEGNKTGEELFFHYGDGQFTAIDGGNIVFYSAGAQSSRPSMLGMAMPQVRLNYPEKGDRIAFTRGSGKGGKDKASPWTFASSYEASRKSLLENEAERPVQQTGRPDLRVVPPLPVPRPVPAELPRYRVTKHENFYSVVKDRVVWEGTDTLELSTVQHKRDTHGTISDKLEAGSADGGDMSWYYWIEQQQADGTWEQCEDPRVFLCCVPRDVFMKHATSAISQGRCTHANRKRQRSESKETLAHNSIKEMTALAAANDELIARVTQTLTTNRNTQEEA